jgi:hypothetical protein
MTGPRWIRRWVERGGWTVGRCAVPESPGPYGVVTIGKMHRVVGGFALLTAPVVWGAGLLLRYLATRTASFSEAERVRFAAEPFAAPGQLATYVERPALFTAGLALYLAGVLLLLPATAAIVGVSSRPGRRGWRIWPAGCSRWA